MKVRIIYNEHPWEEPAREIALELKKVYKGNRNVLFTEFDHGRMLRGFKVPSTTKENDEFVDRYFSFLIDKYDSPGSHCDYIYLFFRKYPEFLQQINDLYTKDPYGALQAGLRLNKKRAREYARLARTYDRAYDEEQPVLFKKYKEARLEYIKSIGKGVVLLNLHNGTLPWDEKQAGGGALTLATVNVCLLSNLFQEMKKKNSTGINIYGDRKPVSEKNEVILEFYESDKPGKMPIENFALEIFWQYMIENGTYNHTRKPLTHLNLCRSVRSANTRKYLELAKTAVDACLEMKEMP